MIYATKVKCILIYVICFLLLAPTVSIEAKTSQTKGIDVSSYNGVVDWEIVAEQGYTFAMIRIAEGQAPDVDKYFEDNYIGARAAGLKVGVYQASCIRTPEDAVLEALYCLELLDGRELDYPVAYDMEKPGTFAGGIENTTEIVKAYSNVIKEGGYTPMIYSYSYMLNKEFDWEALDDIKVWVAHYDVEEPNFTGTYDIWQYSDKEWVKGASTDLNVCDVNYSFLEAEELIIWNDSLTMGVGESTSAIISVIPDGCTDSIKWKSLNPSVVSVSQKGKIKAKKTGNATIKVTTGSGLTSFMNIVVKKAPSSVKFSTEKKTIKEGNTYQLKPVLSSSTASYKITYVSENKKIASVSSKGVVTGKKAGITNITLRTYNGKTASIKIKVK